MSRKKLHFVFITFLKFALFTLIKYSDCLNAEAIFLNASPANIKKFYPSYGTFGKRRYSSIYHHFPKLRSPTISNEKVFKIEPSDAIVQTKYSQPAAGFHVKVPLSHFIEDTPFSAHGLYNGPTSFQMPALTSNKNQETTSAEPFNSSQNGFRYLDKVKDSEQAETIVTSEYRMNSSVPIVYQNGFESDMLMDMYDPTYQRNNFTDTNDNLFSVPSDPVLSYKTPSINPNEDSILTDTSTLKQNSERAVNDITSLDIDRQKVNSSDAALTIQPVLEKGISEFATQTNVLFNTHPSNNQSDFNSNNVIEYETTAILSETNNEGNMSAILPSIGNDSEKLSSGVVAGIVISVLLCVTVLSSSVIYLLYRRYNGKCTNVVESKLNSENCGYLDDSLRSSMYLNNHIELPKENSEEMTSLDNDSFLNSLETMTIQNYWADNSKNTKV